MASSMTQHELSNKLESQFTSHDDRYTLLLDDSAYGEDRHAKLTWKSSHPTRWHPCPHRAPGTALDALSAGL
jgi:hypothetical protein